MTITTLSFIHEILIKESHETESAFEEVRRALSETDKLYDEFIDNGKEIPKSLEKTRSEYAEIYKIRMKEHDRAHEALTDFELQDWH